MYDGDIVLTVDLDPRDAISASETLRQDIEKIFKEASGKDMSSRFMSVLNTLTKLHQRAGELQTAMEKLQNTKIETQEYKEATAELDRLDKEFDKLLTKAENFKDKRILTDDYKKLQLDLASANKQYERLSNQIATLKAAGKTGTTRYDGLTKQLQYAEREITRTTTAMKELEAAGKAWTTNPEYRTLFNHLKDVKAEYDNIYQKVQDMRTDGTAFIPGDETDQYDKLTGQLNAVINASAIAARQLEEMQTAESGVEIGAGNTARAFNPIIAIFQRLGGAIDRVRQALMSGLNSGLKLVKSGADKVTAAIKKASAEALKLAGSKVKSGLKSLATSFGILKRDGNDTNKMFKKGFTMLLKYGIGVRSFYFLMRKLRKALSEGFGDLAQVHEPFNQAMSSMMTALRTLRNSFASAFAPIIETVAPIITKFINLMADAVNKVGMFIAALTGKEFVKAVPAYQNYADSMSNGASSASDAADAMGDQNKAAKELKRTLAGFDDVEILHEDKDTDTASGGGGGGGGAGGGTGFATAPISSVIGDFAQKFKEAWQKADFYEIGRTIGDKLNEALQKIPWTKIKNTLSKLGKSIATFLNGLFDTPGLFTNIGKTLAEGINSALTFLNSFVKNLDWAALGRSIKDLILGAFKNIDWALVFDTVAELGKGIGTAIQNALNNPEMWTTLFTSMGNRIKALLTFVNEFLKSIDWSEFGKNIALGLNSAIQSFDWKLLAETLSRAINSVIDLLYNFITTFDFLKFGESIGKSISDAIANINWLKAGSTLANALVGLLDALHGFLTSVDWASVGKAIIDVIIGFFGDFKWSSVSTVISDLWISGCTALTAAVEDIDWDSAPQGIVDAISEFFGGFDWDGMASAAGGLLGAAFGAIATVGSDLWNDMLEFGSSIMDGGLDGIIDALKEIGKWIKDNIVDPFVEAFKKQFGITGDSKVGALFSAGIEIVGKIFSGIINAVVGIGEWIYKHIIKPFIDGFKEKIDPQDNGDQTVSLGGRVIMAIFKGIRNVIKNIGIFIKTHIIDPFIKSFKEKLGINDSGGGFLDIGAAILKAIWQGIKNTILGIGTFIKDEIITPFIAGFMEIFNGADKDSILDIGRAIFEGILDGILQVVISIGTWIYENVWKPVVDGFKNIFGIHSPAQTTNFIGIAILEGILQGIIDTIVGIGEWIQKNIFDPIIEGFKSIFGIGDGQEGATSGSIFDIGAAILNTLFAGILSIAETIGDFLYTNIIEPILTAFADLGQQILDFFTGGWDEGENSFQAMQGATATTDEFTTALNNLKTVGEQLEDSTAWSYYNDALQTLHDQGKLTDDQLFQLRTTIMDVGNNGGTFSSQVGTIAAQLENAGISGTDFNDALGGMYDKAKDAGIGLEELSTQAETADTNTSNAGTAVDNFKNLGLSVPLKIALLTAALKNLADKGALSDDDVSALQDTLDNTDSTNFDETMGEVKTALDKGKVSGEDFRDALVTGSSKVKTSVRSNLKATLSSITDFSTDSKDAGETNGKNIDDGFIKGMQAKKQAVINQAQTVVDTYILDTMDTAADSHSPSKETKKRGEYLATGLINGIKGKQPDIKTAASTTITTFISVISAQEVLDKITTIGNNFITSLKSGITTPAGTVAIQTAASSILTTFITTINTGLQSIVNAGASMITSLTNGMSNNKVLATNAVSNIIQSIRFEFTVADWWELGNNIGQGLYNGLIANSARLRQLARNTAIEMYNAAVWALDIGSPSKKFAWIGQMMMAGWENGIEKNAEMPLTAVESTIDDLTDAANSISTEITPDSVFNATVTTLDDILTRFADIITDRFTNLILSLEKLNISSGTIPDIVRGHVVPNNIRQATTNSDISKILNMLTRLTDNQISLEALTTNMTRLMQTYCGDLYIGDEQIARHANAGNIKLNRRYNTI